jgi:transposase-like protein
VKCNVPVAEAITAEGVLPERVQEALGEMLGAAREGLLALSVQVGLDVLRGLLEEEVDELVGPKGRWNRDRTAVRHGHEDGEVTLGGRRVQVKRPRARTADGESEVPLVTYEHFAERDQLADVVLERMLAGVSTRKYRRAQEPVGEQVVDGERSTSKSAVSRTFVARTRDQLWNLMNRPLADLRLAVIMLDGIELHGRTNIVALGISTEGEKLALGLWDGSTENATVAAALLSDLVDRGLDVEQGMLFVIDGGKALRKAIPRCSATTYPSSAVCSTSSATCSTTSPSATARQSRRGCARRGHTPTTPPRSSSSPRSRSSSTAPTPARPPRCAKGWRRR